jgi:hypothetical protein
MVWYGIINYKLYSREQEATREEQEASPTRCHIPTAGGAVRVRQRAANTHQQLRQSVRTALEL